jgi:hypothetical protein
MCMKKVLNFGKVRVNIMEVYVLFNYFLKHSYEKNLKFLYNVHTMKIFNYNKNISIFIIAHL